MKNASKKLTQAAIKKLQERHEKQLLRQALSGRGRAQVAFHIWDVNEEAEYAGATLTTLEAAEILWGAEDEIHEAAVLAGKQVIGEAVAEFVNNKAKASVESV